MATVAAQLAELTEEEKLRAMGVPPAMIERIIAFRDGGPDVIVLGDPDEAEPPLFE